MLFARRPGLAMTLGAGARCTISHGERRRLIVENIRNEDLDKGMAAVEILRAVLNNGKASLRNWALSILRPVRRMGAMCRPCSRWSPGCSPRKR